MKPIRATAGAWYKTRAAHKEPAQLWMMRNELTNVITIRLRTDGGKKLDIDLDVENMSLLAELVDYWEVTP